MNIKQKLRHFLAKVGNLLLPAAISDPRTSPAAKTGLISIYLDLQLLARQGKLLPRLADSGFRIFSQCEEDGYLLFLAAVLEIESKSFIDIGAADGIASNCANLALNLGWHGLFIEGDAEKVRRGETFYSQRPDTNLYPPIFRHARVTRENINQLIKEAGFSGAVGILSLDIDGNDYWVWEALDVVQPAVVIVETNTEFGFHNIVVPYEADRLYPGKDAEYYGASPFAMTRLAQKKGYRLVGANRFGFNLIFVKRDIFEERVPEVALESVLQHPRYFERLSLFETVKDFPYVSPQL